MRPSVGTLARWEKSESAGRRGTQGLTVSEGSAGKDTLDGINRSALASHGRGSEEAANKGTCCLQIGSVTLLPV